MEKKKDLEDLWVAEQGCKVIVEMVENSDFEPASLSHPLEACIPHC